MKHTINTTMYVHAAKNYLTGDFDLRMMACEMSNYGYIFLDSVEVSIDYDLPENFNFTQAEIDTLRKEQKNIQAEAQMKLTQIEDRIQRLLCIEHKAAA